MEKMTQEHMEDIVPDGTTPLMQLFANVSRKTESSTGIEGLIIQLFTSGKIKWRSMMDTCIIFGNLKIFKQ